MPIPLRALPAWVGYAWVQMAFVLVTLDFPCLAVASIRACSTAMDFVRIGDWRCNFSVEQGSGMDVVLPTSITRTIVVRESFSLWWDVVAGFCCLVNS